MAQPQPNEQQCPDMYIPFRRGHDYGRLLLGGYIDQRFTPAPYGYDTVGGQLHGQGDPCIFQQVMQWAKVADMEKMYSAGK